MSYAIGGTDLIRTFSNAGTLENNTTYEKPRRIHPTTTPVTRSAPPCMPWTSRIPADVLSCPRVTHERFSRHHSAGDGKYYPTEWDEAEYTMMGNNVPVFTGSVPNLDEELRKASL